MERKRFKKISVVVALLGAFFMFGAGADKAQALTDSEYYAIVAGFYQGVGEEYAVSAWIYGDVSYVYAAYQYFYEASSWAYYAATYAYDYNTYDTAYTAYSYLNTAASYAYDGWYYDYSVYTEQAIYYGGLAAQSLAYTQYYASY